VREAAGLALLLLLVVAQGPLRAEQSPRRVADTPAPPAAINAASFDAWLAELAAYRTRLAQIVVAIDREGDPRTDARGAAEYLDVSRLVLDGQTQAALDGIAAAARADAQKGDWEAALRQGIALRNTLDGQAELLMAITRYWRHVRGWRMQVANYRVFMRANQAEHPFTATIEPREAELQQAVREDRYVQVGYRLAPALEADMAAAMRAVLDRAAAASTVDRRVLEFNKRCPRPGKRTLADRAEPWLDRKASPPLQKYYGLAASLPQQDGQVAVAMRVDASGCLRRLALRVSSGYPELDAVVLAWMSEATYRPAVVGGQPIDAEAIHTMRVRLLVNRNPAYCETKQPPYCDFRLLD
jgi:TonB family protein